MPVNRKQICNINNFLHDIYKNYYSFLDIKLCLVKRENDIFTCKQTCFVLFKSVYGCIRILEFDDYKNWSCGKIKRFIKDSEKLKTESYFLCLCKPSFRIKEYHRLMKDNHELKDI